MPASAVETLTNPRDSLPNVYTGVTEREQDFVTVFGKTWEALQQIMGIMRPIKKDPGTRLKSYRASVALESGDVGAGNVIPYSKATVEEVLAEDLTIEKYSKAVPIEDVVKYGAEIAVEKTDEAFQNELIGNVLTRFYTFLKTGALTGTYTTWQMALAMAKGHVLNKFKAMRKSATDVVGFANILDAYEYVGQASVTIQTKFGVSYVEDFLGYSTLFLLSAPDIPRGYVAATPVENIDLYYVDPSADEFARMGLVYTTDPELPLIGFHANGNYSTATGESFALMGMKLWAEYLDGISIMSFAASGSLGSLTVSTAAYSAGETGDSTVTISTAPMAGGRFYWKAQASTAPADATYGADFNTTGWTEVKSGDVVHTTNGHKFRLVEVNGVGQAVASATGNVVAKT